MFVKPRASLLSLAIILGLVFSAVSPSIVHADGETTPSPAPTEATSEPTEVPVTPEPTEAVVSTDQAAATEAPTEVVATPAPTEEVAPTEQAAATEAPTEAAATPAPTEEVAPADQAQVADPASTEAAAPTKESTTPAADSTVLSSVPENTTVTVLDSNGNVEPLATQATADAIATSDPIWCPGGQAPTPGANGCTQSFSSFDALLTYLSANPSYQGAGTIYVQQGAYQGNDPNKVINFNSPSYNLGNINNSDLTVTGGWNPSNNTIDSASPTTFNGYSIVIGSTTNPWGGSLTITNIVVSDSPTNGIELHATGDVNVDNSKFDRNRRNGAIIRAGKNANITNSSFSNDTTARSQKVGLDIVSGGSVSLFEVIANNNRFTGTNINASGDVIIVNSDFSHTKHAEMGGVSFYDTRLLVNSSGVVYSGYGLLVITPNTITIDNVTANDNFLWGASLDAGGDIAVSNSLFNANTTAVPSFIDDTGLIINGDADVALNNVTASDNRLYGALIDAQGTVSIDNSNFNNNRGVVTINGVTTLNGHGLKINSLADIFIDSTNATNNMLFGGQLTAGGQVSISDSNFSDTSTDPGQSTVGKGLDIVSTGNTSLANVVLNHNQTDGADIKAGGDIYLDVVTATNNGMDGVAVQNSCTHVFGGEYSGNGQYGLNLGNSALDLESPATMFNNGAGNIFPANPAVCTAAVGNVPPVPGSNPPVIGGDATTSTDLSNLFVGYFTSKTTGPDISTENVSLNTFLAANTSGIADYDPSDGPFTGRYVYVNSNDGLIYIVALVLED
jgi:hypothetical protein